MAFLKKSYTALPRSCFVACILTVICFYCSIMILSEQGKVSLGLACNMANYELPPLPADGGFTLHEYDQYKVVYDHSHLKDTVRKSDRRYYSQLGLERADPAIIQKEVENIDW